jgi:phosphohistidine phosphatase SixA
MDKNDIARKLAKFGKQEARLMAKLAEVQAERCALLQSVAQEADLEPEVVALSVAPKDDD